MSIEALLERVAVGLERVADNQERLIAGQAAAIDKVEADKPKRETKAEKAAREAAEKAAVESAAGNTEAAGNDAPADTATGADAASSASEPATTAATTATAAPAPGEVTDEMLKATALAFSNAVEAVEDKTARAQWFQKIAHHLVPSAPADQMLKMTGPDSKLTADDRKKFVFFIKRAHKLKGMEHVDFSAPYDFDADPMQDVARVEVEEFDPLG